MEVYESHLGGDIYFSEEVIPFEDRYCEICGDTDWHLGHADTWEDVLELLTELGDDGEEWIPYTADYIEELKATFIVKEGE